MFTIVVNRPVLWYAEDFKIQGSTDGIAAERYIIHDKALTRRKR